jgi:ATP/ADP translocase
MEMQTENDGVYCSTAGAVFQEREALQEHYHSEFHRYVHSLVVCGFFLSGKKNLRKWGWC